MSPPEATVAAIDVGSNTLKSLVATGTPQRLVVRHEATREVRISAGSSGNPPQLAAEVLAAARDAVSALWEEALAFRPDAALLTATSAVRDAANRDAAIAALQVDERLPVRILSGLEEAAYIARGVATDPQVSGLERFHIVDLGGGSLEITAVRSGRVEHAESFPLGAVRLMRAHVDDPRLPFPEEARAAVQAVVRETLREVPAWTDASAPWVGTGGAFVYARRVLAQSDAEGDRAELTAEAMRALLDRVAAMTTEERVETFSLPPNRADIFPVALTVLTTLANLVGFTSFRHSYHNLRYGVAAELLAQR